MTRDIKLIAGLTIMGTAMSISGVYANNQEGIVNTSVLNIRSGPSTNYTILTQVKLGNKLQILEKNNGWYKVKLSNESTGWASSYYISMYTGSTSQTGSSTNNPSNISKAQAIVKTDHEQLGKLYVWGSEGSNSFDCSGLVHYIFGKDEVQTLKVL